MIYDFGKRPRRALLVAGNCSLLALAVTLCTAPAHAQQSDPKTVTPSSSTGTDNSTDAATSTQAPESTAIPVQGSIPANGNPSDPGDIIVTATRGRAQSLQSIPMAVSAIQASTLDTKGIDNIADIVKSVPSVNIVERGPGQSQITIRGISSGAFSITETGDRPLVSVYLDDVPISIQGANPDLKVFDLERIEVLRGPQGTLYGSGSMAGTIRYITVKPSTDHFSGAVESNVSGTSHANDPNWNVRGTINVPLGETLALLVSGYTGRDSGWIDNIGIGRRAANSARTTQARTALRWTGVAGLTVDASVLYGHLDTGGLPVGYSGLSRYQYDSLSPESFRDNLLVANVTADYELGGGHLTSSTSYIDRHYISDVGGFSYEYINAFAVGGVRTPGPSVVDQHLHTLTEEVRYVSNPDQPLTYSLGGFYEHTRRNYEQNLVLRGVDSAQGLPSIPFFGTPFADDLFYGLQHIKERQFAVFGEANYKFSDKFDLTAGVRYFNFRQDFNLAFTGLAGSGFVPNPSGSPTFLPLTQSGSPKANGFNPRFVGSYHANKDAMVFAEISKGFRYGSVNEPVASQFCNGATAPTTVGSDSLWNYALGLKTQFADRRVTFNVTGFYIDWKNPQARVDLSCGYYYRINAGRIESRGVELETAFRPAPGLTLTLNGSYTDARAKETVAIAGADPIVTDGDRAPLFPKWLGSLGASYQFTVSSGKMTLTSDVQYRGNFYNRFSPLNINYRETPDQTLLNASATYDFGRYEIGVYGTNLTNSRNLSLIDSVRARPGSIVAPREAIFYGRPLTVGLRGKVRF